MRSQATVPHVVDMAADTVVVVIVVAAAVAEAAEAAEGLVTGIARAMVPVWAREVSLRKTCRRYVRVKGGRGGR
jgi:hypothetical protein